MNWKEEILAALFLILLLLSATVILLNGIDQQQARHERSISLMGRG